MEGLWLAKKRQKTVESQAENTNWGVPGLYPTKNRYNAFWTNGRARRVRIWLDFILYMFLAPNGLGIPVFGRCPNTIYKYLYLSYIKNMEKKEQRSTEACTIFNHMQQVHHDLNNTDPRFKGGPDWISTLFQQHNKWVSYNNTLLCTIRYMPLYHG